MGDYMDRRLHERTRVQFEAKVTHLTTQEQSAIGRVCDLSESGISIMLPFQLTANDVVRLEMADSTLAGHVVYSKPEGPEFRVGIAVERVLLGKSELSNLLQRILSEEMPTLPGIEPSETQLC